VVRTTNPYGRILAFLDRVAAQSYRINPDAVKLLSFKFQMPVDLHEADKAKRGEVCGDFQMLWLTIQQHESVTRTISIC
jgi:hypothetical protein